MEAAQETPSEARRQRRREETRRAILAATEELLIEREGEPFSIRQLAERCGYTAPTVYHYFGDKAGLIDALLEDHFSKLALRASAVGREGDPVERMRKLARVFVEFGQDTPPFYRLLLTSSREGTERTPPSVEQVQTIMEAPLRELEAQGRLFGDDLSATQQAFWALTHGLTSLTVSRPDADWSPRLFDIAIDAMLRGAVRPPEETVR